MDLKNDLPEKYEWKGERQGEGKETVRKLAMKKTFTKKNFDFHFFFQSTESAFLKVYKIVHTF